MTPPGGIGGGPVVPPADCDGGGGGGGGNPQFVEAYDCVNDTLTITATDFDFTPVVTVNYTGNGNGQVTRPPHFTLDSPTQITFQQASFFLNGGVLTQLDFFVGPTVAASWTGSVLLAPCPPAIQIDNVVPAGPNYIGLSGSGFDLVSRFRVIDDFGYDVFVYDSSGPNAGLNPPGMTVTVYSPNSVIIGSLDMAGLTITQVQARDAGDAVADEWYGSVLVESAPDPNDYPLLESVCSPALDTVRFVGQRFLTAGFGPVGYVVVRMADYASGCLDGPTMIVNLAAPGPWSVVSHTDTEIELSTPLFTSCEPDGGPGDFVVTGAAFHDGIDQSQFYYYEPWGEAFAATIDGAGC